MSELKHLIYALGMAVIFILIKQYERNHVVLSNGTADNYMVITPSILKKVYMMMFAVGIILYGAFLILYLKKVAGVTKGHLRFAFVFAVIGLIVVAFACKWRLEVSGERMKMSPLLNKTIMVDVCELDKARIDSKGGLTIYYKGKKVMKVDPLCVNYDKLCDTLFKYHKL